MAVAQTQKITSMYKFVHKGSLKSNKAAVGGRKVSD
jgi:hypothetical protein